MNTDLYFIQGIEEVELAGLTNEGLELNEHCTIFPINDQVRQVAKTMFLPIVGRVQHQTIVTAGAANMIAQTNEGAVEDDSAKRSLLAVMTWTQLFLFSLWLVKDNSGNATDGHALLVEDSTDNVRMFSQRPGVLNFTAESRRVATSYSAEEVRVAIQHFHRLQEIMPRGEWHFDEPRPSGLVFGSRIVRSMYFAQAARSSADVAVKILFYCLAFESLFASSSDSISHRVSERAASIIDTSGEERRKIYRDVRQLYSTRSQVVHGNPLRARDLPALREQSKQGDDHLRQNIRRIIGAADLFQLFSGGGGTPVDELFLKQLFP